MTVKNELIVEIARLEAQLREAKKIIAFAREAVSDEKVAKNGYPHAVGAASAWLELLCPDYLK